MNALRKIAAGSLAAVLACSMAACGSGNANSTDSASNTCLLYTSPSPRDA